MSMYEQLDERIITAIRRMKSPHYEREVNALASELAKEQGREAYRVIDQRLQAMRKAGKIVFMTRKEAYLSGGVTGWNISPESEKP